MSVHLQRWITISGGFLWLNEKKKTKSKYPIDAQYLEIMGDYLFAGVGSKIEILKVQDDQIQAVGTLFGHHAEVILIRVEPSLDVILSVDKSGLVLLHEMTELRFFRTFHLGVEFADRNISKLKARIHRMGYFIFLDHEQTLHIYKYFYCDAAF
jgi:hypothetical protein